MKWIFVAYKNNPNEVDVADEPDICELVDADSFSEALCMMTTKHGKVFESDLQEYSEPEGIQVPTAVITGKKVFVSKQSGLVHALDIHKPLRGEPYFRCHCGGGIFRAHEDTVMGTDDPALDNPEFGAPSCPICFGGGSA